ncbi:MAG: hypothetical protein CM1200mP30_17240 [Pseudomonadota bacterium]|nr:MAG: hypothetical protein CM1200mP30_17240 [Pseudomonadota bacterium]
MSAYTPITPPNRINQRRVPITSRWELTLKALNPNAYTFIIPFLIIFLIFGNLSLFVGEYTPVSPTLEWGQELQNLLDLKIILRSLAVQKSGVPSLSPFIMRYGGTNDFFYCFGYGGLCQLEIPSPYSFTFCLLCTLCLDSLHCCHYLELDVSNTIRSSQRYYGFNWPARPDCLVEDKNLVLPEIVFISSWWVAGFSMVIFLAALQNIPGDLNEAAALMGQIHGKSSGG